MILYNITIKVEWSIVAEWLQWMQDIYIPEILGTGCFGQHRLLKLVQVDDADGPTYALQLFADTMARYDHFLKTYALGFVKQASDKWGDRYVDFRTLMEVIE